jgi:hypothetical protein
LGEFPLAGLFFILNHRAIIRTESFSRHVQEELSNAGD